MRSVHLYPSVVRHPAILCTEFPSTQEKVKEIIRRVDTKGDGVIDFEEVCKT